MSVCLFASLLSRSISAQRTLEIAQRRCSKPCRPISYKICNGDILDSKYQTICGSRIDTECFEDTRVLAEQNVTLNPCTLVQYAVDVTTYDSYVHENEVEFVMVYVQPVKVNVKEEYLIYDMHIKLLQ